MTWLRDIIPPYMGQMKFMGQVTVDMLAREAALLIALGFLTAAIVGAILIPFLRKFNIVQHAYEDAPSTHQIKTGTPTMGGICFVLGILPLVLISMIPGSPAAASPGAAPWSNLFELFALVAGCAAVGALDDLMAIRFGKNRGLRARTKFLFTALIAIMFLRSISDSSGLVGWVFFSPHHVLILPYWLWLVLGIFAIAGTINAVNLTDGLDGLATGTILPPLLVIGFIALQIEGSGEFGGLLAVSGIGACLAFLLYNHHPAKLFMGDTGSLALGALLSGTAIVCGQMLLLVIIGGVFVAEALSVMLQVVYFKLTHGKRIFKMSPLHHHFELSGWPETKVTTRFWIASAICSAVGLAIVR
jgi:phospho-N-acetylmuramoyl-pentapeptide-transferase